jgi:hypothetical protein
MNNVTNPYPTTCPNTQSTVTSTRNDNKHYIQSNNLFTCNKLRHNNYPCLQRGGGYYFLQPEQKNFRSTL